MQVEIVARPSREIAESMFHVKLGPCPAFQPSRTESVRGVRAELAKPGGALAQVQADGRMMARGA